MRTSRSLPARPLAHSLARFSSAAAMLAALALAGSGRAQAQNAVVWQGNSNVPGAGVAGDGFLWTTPTNWSGDVLPPQDGSFTFGDVNAGTIVLNGNQTVGEITFNKSFTLGTYGTSNVLTNTGGIVTVQPNQLVTINSIYSSSAGLSLGGGGTLYLTNWKNDLGTSQITVDGAGTTLMANFGGFLPQVNTTNATVAVEYNNRLNAPPLSTVGSLRTINLSNGGEFKLIGGGANPDGTTIGFSLFQGAGAINVAAGYQRMVLDDASQIVGTGDLIKNGKGRLSLVTQDYNLIGNVTVNAGILDLNRTVAVTGPTGVSTTRFSSFAGTLQNNTSTFNVNSGGTLLLNGGGGAVLDIANVIANNGAVLASQGGDIEFGVRVESPNTLTINGTVDITARDLFTTTQNRAVRINSKLQGDSSAVLEVNGATGTTAGTLVLQRSDAGSDFSGTIRLLNTSRLENNPRNTNVFFGKTLGNATVELNGFGSVLDLRDTVSGTSVVTNTLLNSGTSNYTSNKIAVTTTQAGALPIISVNRSTDANSPASTGNVFDFGTLTMGSNRVRLDGSNSYGLAFNTFSVTGSSTIELNTSPLTLLGGATETSAGNGITFIKRGAPNAGAFDVTSAGTISVSNLTQAFGTLNLRGANGSVGAAFGGAAPVITINGGDLSSAGRGNPTQGILHLDNNGSVVGVTAANNNDRVVDSAIVNMRSNSILRLTSANNIATTETIGTINVSGHGLIDIVKTGTPTAPVALTVNTLNLTGTKATLNFTGTSLGATGANSSRILIGNQASTAFLGSQYHVGNEWAKYDTTLDNGVAVGVTPFVAADYAIGTGEATWDATQNIKQTASVTLGGNRSVKTLNLQPTATYTLNTGGFTLNIAGGGLLTSGSTAGIVGNNGVGALTSSNGDLYVHNNAQLDLKVPVVDYLGADGLTGGGDDVSVNFIKSGAGTLRLTHQSLGVGTAAQGQAPYTTAPWTSTLTGSWIINDGVLDVHRGAFLGGRPVVLNGGIFQINEPVAGASGAGGNSHTVLTGWGNNVIVNGNAQIASDDNGESVDANVGGNTVPLLGSLTVNNGATLGLGAFNGDIAFMGGAIFNGRATLNMGTGRASSTNHAHIISGAITGSGFDIVSYTGTNQSLVLGGGPNDTTHNTFDSAVVAYGANATVRLNKANGFDAIPNTPATEDLIINGSTVAWGPGHHGDLSLTGSNDPNVTNNGLFGIAPTSPAAIRNSGMNQINDNATVTLLSGTLGEADRINVDKWATLIQKNGTLNVGIGAIEVNVAEISGGALGINPGGALKAGTLNLQVGAYSPNITTGLPGDPSKMSTLEIGAGGLNMTGQNIIIGGGSSSAIAGAGAVLKLGGNVTAVDDPLLGNSNVQGIFIQIGNSFRELGNSKTDLLGGNRTFTISPDVEFFVTTPVTNGGLIKEGGGILVLQPHQASDFTGPITVNNGVLAARANNAFGAGAGGVTINAGGTVKLESGWTYGDTFTINGAGAIIPGTTNVRELGALVSESGRNRIQGNVVLAADATIAANGVMNPSATPSTGAGFWASELTLENAGGVTGTGTLTLSGNGNGVIVGGVNTTAGGLNKDGGGVWTISGASNYTGTTLISAGRLRITNGNALGSTAAGTTVYGGGSLELAGGITVNEPLTINDGGVGIQSGPLTSAGGNNIYAGGITLGTDAVISSQSGNLAITGNVGTGAAPNNNRNLTLTGRGSGSISSAVALGSGGLTKSGNGTWTLAGANTFTGGTKITAGNLVLDYTANNSNKVSGTSPITLGGGNLIVQGNAGANTTQTVGGLTLTSGGGTIQVTNGVGRSATLNLGAINLPVDEITQLPISGATVNFVLPQSGAITATTALTNGIIGGYATVGQDWATKAGANTIVPFTAYTPLDVTGAGSMTENSRLSATRRLTGPVTTNSLKLENGASLALDFNTLTLASGGLIYNGTGDTRATISSIGGAISGGVSGDSELFINTVGGTLDIAAALNNSFLGAPGLTKTGAGTLFVRNNSSNGYLGPVTVNGGTLAIIGLGGTHPSALGPQNGQRNVILNGGTFRVVGGYDLNVTGGSQMQMVIGAAGGTIRQEFGGYYNDSNGGFWMNDLGQLSGVGDLTLSGGGRFRIDNNYSPFTGNVVVDASVLRVNNVNSIGGRAEQTITLKAGSMLINEAGSNQQFAGLPNNLVLEGGATLVAQNGNRAFTGDVQLSGTNKILLADRDIVSTNTGVQRDLHLMGRISGSQIKLDVTGSSNANALYLSNASNDFTGTINLGTNATLEARQTGSLGQAVGDVTVNLNGANSRLLLRHWQNADFRANVMVNNTAEISADRLVNYNGGSGQLLSINDLTVNGGQLLQFGGGNAYVPQVKGTATFNASPILNVTNNVLFENGINYTATSGNTLDKRGTGALILRGPANHTGVTLIQSGVVDLRGANGSLPNTSKIDLRGGELRIENGDAVNNNRLSDTAAVVFGGGTLRINGDETFANNVSSEAGNTVVFFNPGSETVTSAITFNNFSRSVGATVQLQVAENGGATVGALNLGNARTTPRIIVPGLSNTGNTDVVRGIFGNNGIDFVQYDGTTSDGGKVLGLRDMRNPGSINSPTYTNDEAETGWTDTDIARTSQARTLTANRALDALKVEAAVTIDTATFNLRIENGGILAAGAAVSLNGSGSITAGPATPGTAPAELFLGGNNTLTVNANVVNNGTDPKSAQPVALVKTGSGTVVLASPGSTFTGGIFHNSGTLTVNTGTGLGPNSNTITLAGGSLNMFTATTESGVNLLNFGHNVAVTSNGSSIILDNGTISGGTAGTNNTYAMGKLSINGPYTLAVSGFDSMDMSFNGADFTGSPVIDLAQISGRGTGSVVSIGGNITGTGFNVVSSGNVASTAASLNIGNSTAAVPDTTPNTFTGKVVMLNTFPAQQNQPTVQLNKAAGTTAIPGDIEINAGMLSWLADNQIADTGKITLNFGTVDLLGKSETIGGLTMTGGAFRTHSSGDTATTSSTFTINGDADLSGVTQTVSTQLGTANPAGTLQGTGFEVSSKTTVNITGVLRMSGFSRVTVGATGATLNLGGLEMTGTVISQISNVGGANTVRLNGDVTTFASEVPALLGNSNDSDTYLELNGSRTFNVADGPAGEDLLISSVMRNDTSAGGVGGIVKNGAGTVEIRGGGTANTFTGPTTINEGALVLFKNNGTSSIGSGAVTIGDGVGGAKADKLVVRNSNQINDAADVTVAASGLLDLATFNTSEQINSLAGSGFVDVGPNSTLTVSGLLDSVFSGVVSGSGGVTKAGASKLALNGANDYLGQTSVNEGTLVVRGSIGGISTLPGATLEPGSGPGLLNVRGDFDLQSGATLKIELGGTAPGTGYDRINVTGAISLAGDLQGSLINGFAGSKDYFFILINDGTDPVNGIFNGLPEGAQVDVSGQKLFITYQANFEGIPSLTGGNDIALVVPEPTAGVSLLMGVSSLLGVKRFRRRSKSV